MKDKTVIVIAHRLSTLSQMDRIIVLDEGKIVEEGVHSLLLKQRGHYASMWEHQAGGFLPPIAENGWSHTDIFIEAGSVKRIIWEIQVNLGELLNKVIKF